jgi:CrcB protein
MQMYVLVALGSALGGMARFFVSGWIARLWGEAFPWGTIVINITGSFLIGFFGGLTGPDGRYLAPPELRTFFMVGVCGGYTTFSSFSLQTLNLARDGELLLAGSNVTVSVILCLVGVWLGSVSAAAINNF